MHSLGGWHLERDSIIFCPFGVKEHLFVCFAQWEHYKSLCVSRICNLIGFCFGVVIKHIDCTLP